MSEHSDEQKLRSSTTRKLYTSHFLSTWNMRLFEFGAVLFLANIYPNTLLPMSIYALVRALAAVLLSPLIGQYIDRTDRLVSIRLSIIGQRCAVICSCLLFWAMLEKAAAYHARFGAVSLAILSTLACIEKLCATANTVAIERDWVVVIGNNHETHLQDMNAQMRRIDLFCKLIGPLAIALIDGLSPRIAVLVTLGLNAISMAAEYGLIARVYHAVPGLQEHGISDAEEADPQQSLHSARSGCMEAGLGVKAYITSAAFLPSFSLSLLYLTVLSFSGQMITYLLTFPTLTPSIIGGIRTIATIFELASTWLAPYLISRIGPTRAGIWCLSFQITCLSISISTFFFHNTTTTTHSTPLASTTTYLLITTIILSRIGLYAFDLIAQLIIQNSIPSTHRASFSTTEASVQNLFELITFLTTIIFPKPEQFKIPACVSYLAVCAAGALYAMYVRDRRGHLLHLPQCCCGENWAKGHWHHVGHGHPDADVGEEPHAYQMVPSSMQTQTHEAEFSADVREDS
jgi:iron-regulated transporter 1